eukprot:CAMPEP_0174368024 /NCGR_PEP_ID=MMETSP0811_2-20130205/87535_1 /TAXON_ID=73025 ORGANISM="Eutreptiella gymnastica-like, Strain CCMP1594" /NCGR_SAMPLE_ID=MMETSP0811_2 /ASSEMBLY_ACC=CAM_ASM_000667 /LENGTH=68 /DNA_ID=CAMNT_0015511155 /DNA_START=208 /DNA_END=414 /DNA_ORIENTATION=-
MGSLGVFGGRCFASSARVSCGSLDDLEQVCTPNPLQPVTSLLGGVGFWWVLSGCSSAVARRDAQPHAV